MAVRVFASVFSDGDGDLVDKLCDPIKEDRDQGELGQDGGSFEASHLWFAKSL